MSASLHMRLLGGFALEHQGAPITIASPRLQALLAYLALRRGEPQPRRRLAFLLWPDSSEAQAQTNLRTVLHRSQATLPALNDLLRVDAQAIGWSPERPVALDVDAFEEALRAGGTAEASGDEQAAIAAFERAVASYAGDLLPDCYDEWVQPARERLRDSLLDALAHLAALLERRRDYAAAIAHTRRLARLEPLNEATYLTLMRLHALNGDRSGALRVYHSCATTLQQELGEAPGIALREAYEQLLAAETPAVVRDTAAGTALVGRNTAWRQMQAAWETSAVGRSMLLLLAGEAGMGKTRLAEEMLRWAGRQGVITLAAHCYQAEGTLPYAPIVAWLRADPLYSRLRRLAAPWLAEIGRLVPELLAGRNDLPAPGPVSESWQRQRLFEALARAVLFAERPIMLLLDDVQWCDRDTLEWLHFLLRFDSGVRLLTIGTLRVEEFDEAHPLGALLGALRSAGRLIEISLGPLSRDETAELAERVGGLALAPEQRAQIYDETEGNPLFVVETIHAGSVTSANPISLAQGQPAPGQANQALPAGVQAVLARRLQQVGRAARDVLDVAAVIGRSFTFDVLARAAHLDDDDLVRGLDELWRRRIVREHDAEGYDFTHDKLRAVAYAALSPTRRRRLHTQVARALEAVHATNLDPISGQIAAHFERAGMRQQAADYASRAADVAHRLYANPEAIEHLQRALALLGSSEPAQAAVLHNRLGDLLHLLGRYPEARQSWANAQANTPATEPVALAQLQRKIGNAFRDEYDYDEARGAYDAAETMLPKGAGAPDQRAAPAWAQIQLERVMMAYWLGEIDAMLKLVEHVRPVLETIDDLAQRARLYQVTSFATLRRDRYNGSPEAIRNARAYFDTVEALHDTHLAPAAHFQFGFTLLWSGDLDNAERHMGEALVLAERGGDLSLRGRCLTYLAMIARKRGDAGRVRTYTAQSLDVAIAGHMHDYIGAAHGNMAWLAWRAGDLDQVRAQGQAALAAWQKLPAGYICEWTARWPLIGVALASGETSEAADHARYLLETHQQRPPIPIETAFHAAVEAADGGDLSAAHAHLQAACAPARELGFL